MGFKDILSRLANKDEELKEESKRRKIQRILDLKEKSSNERELDRFVEEERQEQIKEALEYYRKKRQKEIDFNNNPLDIPNVVSKTEWEVLKERNQFSNSKCNILDNGNPILKTKNIFKRR